MLIGNGLRLAKTSVGQMDNNAYLLTHGDDALLIDAAAEADVLLRQLERLRLVAVVTTHLHHDHIDALAAVVEATGAPAYAGRPDAASITEATGVTCREVWDGDVIELGGVGLGVIGLVGHTPGSITLAHTPEGGPARLFTGDSLFPGGVGRTWNAGDFDTLLHDVTTKLFEVYPDDTVVHPGHGADTTLGAERPHLAEWRERGW
ncbi:MBL fold metallo-hydrolase [Micropruina sonneratiae]|uniref:MBL fold metallo-hydrolase n=1 Tax=Micropruina sonneratiae TaxID=2986940 RepID=UPI002225D98A|nr:MBL fold metallo-hydrolase [Micropruina sp. KQZ13P-5]MCW3157177.1 MBL fold metallo-hydrolase [Micropruina sp. KQZ13P-5]